MSFVKFILRYFRVFDVTVNEMVFINPLAVQCMSSRLDPFQGCNLMGCDSYVHWQSTLTCKESVSLCSRSSCPWPQAPPMAECLHFFENYIWNRIIPLYLFCLGSATLRNSFMIHPCLVPSFLFYWSKVFHWMDRTPSVYPFTSWWTFRFFIDFGYCEWGCFDVFIYLK
jgi:hypothetical protein